jgi:antitoxin component YwqK of YwqJK toxin-antitoxin module
MFLKYTLAFIIVVTTSIAVTAQSFDMSGKDTINAIDANNLKQGKWIIKNSTKKLAGYKDDQTVEEGKYRDSKKTGVWKAYFPSNKTKSEITYENNRPKGYAKFYHENGQLAEEGMWENNKWVGEYKMYYENGQLFYDWKYSADGKREGDQKYFHDNGYTMIEGNWNDGKEKGEQKEYYYSGAIKSTKNFNDGKMDEASVKNVEDSGKPDSRNVRKLTIKAPAADVKVEKKDPVNEVKVVEEIKKEEVLVKVEPKAATLVENGQSKLYNKNKQVEQEGMFKNYKLFDGKKYFYEGEKLVRTQTYKNGGVVKTEEVK